jgi:glycine/D-amino acid oxidase-like deaminating enzyme
MTDSRFELPVWREPSGQRFDAVPVADGEHTDLVVVGGGLLGVSTALHAAGRGLSVRLLEAATLGSGASGRNGGQVIPGLKHDPEKLVELFGEQRGAPLVSFAASTADFVFSLIARHRLAVPHLRAGWIQACHTATALEAARERDRQWRRLGADVEMLDAAAIAALTGARGYAGGWLDRRAGVVDPLCLVLEIARVAAGAGARIAENEEAVSLRRSEGLWHVTCRSGRAITARNVLVATNAYSGPLVAGLARSVVTVQSFQIATAPLPARIAGSILPEGQAVSDSRRILVYFRKTPDGRFMLGGRGRMSRPRSEDDWAHLRKAMLRLYPELVDVPVERRWYGKVAIAPDYLPRIVEPEPGLTAVIGCQGRGVALMTALGDRLAERVATCGTAALPLPVTPIRPIPLHGLRHLGLAASIAWFRMRDTLER